MTRHIDAEHPSLFGYPINVTLMLTSKRSVDVTHALREDPRTRIVFLDEEAVRHVITRAYAAEVPERPEVKP